MPQEPSRTFFHPSCLSFTGLSAVLGGLSAAPVFVPAECLARTHLSQRTVRDAPRTVRQFIAAQPQLVKFIEVAFEFQKL